MGLDNYILDAVNARLNNPVHKVLREIRFGTLLKQSNITRAEDGHSPHQVILHFLVMLIANKRLSTFVKQGTNSFAKDTYYRLLKESRYNWRKLLLLSTVRLIQKLHPLTKATHQRVLIIDDTVEEKRGKKIEGSCDYLFSNGKKKMVRGLNIVSLNYSDPYSSFILDFSVAFSKHLRATPKSFTQKLHAASNASKRRMEGFETKLDLALSMVKRVLKQGVVADCLLMDSWYAKPGFLKNILSEGLPVIARLPLNDKIWHFKGKQKTLERIYQIQVKTRSQKAGRYGNIRYAYSSAILEHGKLGRVKVVFIRADAKRLIPILATDTTLSDEEIIETYKKRWDIEQGYKELRQYFGFGKEEARIYEALIARMTLSMFSYNLLNYINRIEHEPRTLGELFRELECELQALAISMERFLQILSDLAEIPELSKRNRDLERIIAVFEAHVQKEMGFRCES